MATFVNQTSSISALGPKFDHALSVSAVGAGGGGSSSNDDVDEKSERAQQFISSLKQRTVVIGHEIEETTTYLLPPATAILEGGEEEEQEEEMKTISELATLTRSAQQMTSSKLQRLMNKLGMKTVEEMASSFSVSASASASRTNLRTTPRRLVRRQQGHQHHHQNQYQQTTMSPRSHHKTPSTSSSINRNSQHHGGGGAAAGGEGEKGGDLFSNLHLSSSPSSLLSNLLLDGPLESVIEADYETDTTTPASSTVSPSTATSTPASSLWSAYKTTKKNSSDSSGYNKWKNSHNSSNNQRHFQSPRNFNSNSGMKSFQSPSPSSRWSTTKKRHQNQKSSSTSPLTPPPMNSLSFSNSTSTFLQHSTTIGLDDGENNTMKEQQNNISDAEEPHFKTKTNNNIFSPYSSSPLSSSSSLHDTTATSNRPKTPGAAALLRPSPPLTNDGNSQNNNNKTEGNENLHNFLPLHRALNFEFREEDDMITLDTQSTLATVPQAPTPPTSTTKQAQSQSQRRRRVSSTSTSTSSTGGGGFKGRETAGVGQYTATSSATKEDRNDFLARMEGMLERVEESMVDDNTTTNSSLFNGVDDNLDEPSRPSDEMNASVFRRHHHHNQYRKSLIGMDDDDSNDSSSNDDSTNIAPTVVQDKGCNSSRVQRQAKSSATSVGQYKERPATQIVVDQSLPSPAHTNITMDNTMITAEFGGLDEDFELPAMKNNGVVQEKHRMSSYSKRESSTHPSPEMSSRDDGSENDPDLDCLSVLTPVLDRYRVEPGGDSSSDIKVIPNQRRPHPTHEAYRKKKMTVKHRVDVGTGNTPYGGVDGTADDDEYQGITPIMSNVPTVSAFQSPPPSSKIKSTPVSSVTSRKKKVYPKTPIPGKFGSKSTTGGENAHPNMSHRNDEDKKQLSFLSPVGSQRTETSDVEFVVPRLRPSTLDESAKRTKGRRVSNSQLSSAGRRPSNAATGWPTTTPSSSLARAQRNWETRDFSSSSMTNDEPYHSSSSSSLVDHESGRMNPVGVRLSKSPM
mmetsp:Transcript_26588/g.63378  ORF Transcript_26588/g.63378 Transcript_26588/m.63378 type:complete len:1020 (-) Transcript_26588:164-3223(-)